jgi:hypothetical protein
VCCGEDVSHAGIPRHATSAVATAANEKPGPFPAPGARPRISFRQLKQLTPDLKHNLEAISMGVGSE